MLKDAIGNELHEGDWVICHVNKMIRLRVVKIEEPGSLTVPNGDAKKQLGFVASQWTAIDPVAKGQEIMPTMFKVHDPSQDKRVDDIIDKAKGPIPIPFKQ